MPARTEVLRELWNTFTPEERALRSALHEFAHGRCEHGCALDDADRRLHVSGFFDDTGLAGWVIVLSGAAPRILVVPLGNGRATLDKLVLLDAGLVRRASSTRVPRRVRETISEIVLDYLGSLVSESAA
jgi:hypothetical protein